MAETISSKQKSAIERSKKSPDLQRLLFNKAVKVRWFSSFKEAGFLSPTDIPAPILLNEEGTISIPNWPISTYLVATSPELLLSENEPYAIEFLNFIRTATRHAKENNFGNYRVWWQFSKVIINVPPHLINLDDLPMFDFWLDDKYERGMVADNLGGQWLMKLLEQTDQHSKRLASGFLEVLYRTKVVEKSDSSFGQKEAVLRFDSWHAKRITSKLADKAGQVLGVEAVTLFQKRLEDILLELDNDKLSSIWRRSIANHAQNSSADDTEDILIEAHRDALLAFVKVAPQQANEYVKGLLNGLFETLDRIAIYVIDQRYQELKNLVDLVITGQYFKSNFRHELWHLLHNRYPILSLTQKKSIKSEIAKIVQLDDSGHKSESRTAYRHAIWLSAIKNYDEDVASLYKQCVDAIGGEPEHPDFSSYVTSGYVEPKSPLSKEELLSLKVPELVECLSVYQDPERFGRPGIEGLVKALREAIKAQPLHYHDQLQQFIKLDLPYIHEIVEGYRELWAENKQLPWDEIWGPLLLFCEEIIKQERFWSEENALRRKAFVANRFWIITSIGMLIEAGTDDEHAFPEKYLEQAKSILLHIIDNEMGEDFKPDSDAVSAAINSPRGRCIEAFINLCLRYCRLADQKHGEHADAWDGFRPTFEIELAKNGVGGYEFVTLVAKYLPQVFYISKTWFAENLGNIFNQANYQKWLCAIQGYGYVNRVYEEVYKYLKESGDFLRALDDENIKRQIDNKITENIAVAYINNFEDLDGEHSLINHLITNKMYSELNHLVWFIWTTRNNANEELKAKVFELWRRLTVLITASTQEGKQLGSKLCDWLVFVDEVTDSNRPLVQAVVMCTDENHFSFELLENISRISERQPFEAYEIWHLLLQVTPVSYPSKAIQSALKNLIRVGPEGIRKSKDVASQYLKAGNEEPNKMLRQMIAADQ